MKLIVPREEAGASLPAVTVVIPCYRYGGFLAAATAAALDQPGLDVRVIIVDDASPDDSADVARRLAEADSRITVIAHRQNAGHIRTYNDGIAAVETPYFSLVSADDLVAPRALTRAVRLMERHPRVGMVYGHAVEFEDGSDLVTSGRSFETWTVWKGIEWLRIAYWRGRCFILSPEVVMRTAVFTEIGGYSEELPHSGDLEYWLRTAARWEIARVNGPAQAYYRVHQSNMHLTRFAGMAQDLRHRATAFEVIRRDPDLLPPAQAHSFLTRARRSLLREALSLARREFQFRGDRETAARLIEAACVIGAGLPGAQRRIDAARIAIDAWRPGTGPSAASRGREWVRVQLDRMRWRLYAAIGIS